MKDSYFGDSQSWNIMKIYTYLLASLAAALGSRLLLFYMHTLTLTLMTALPLPHFLFLGSQLSTLHGHEVIMSHDQ